MTGPDAYAAAAADALACAVLERNDEWSRVHHHFQLLCIRRRLPYDYQLARVAIDAALDAREQARQRFISELRETRLKVMRKVRRFEKEPEEMRE